MLSEMMKGVGSSVLSMQADLYLHDVVDLQRTTE